MRHPRQFVDACTLRLQELLQRPGKAEVACDHAGRDQTEHLAVKHGLHTGKTAGTLTKHVGELVPGYRAKIISNTDLGHIASTCLNTVA